MPPLPPAAAVTGIVHVPCEFCTGRIACPVTERVADPTGVTVRADARPLDNHYPKNHYDQVVTRLRQARATDPERTQLGSLLGVSWT